jgi:phosphohistidine phosphatase SixA
MLLLMVVAPMAGQTPSSEDPIGLLRQGGYVLVMRHASSPREAPTKEQANPDNLKLERQLDESGRRGASAMGEAIRRLQISIGAVLTSPTYRAMETVRLARLDRPQAVSELGDGGQNMQGVSEAQGAWLRSRVNEAPRSGNTILVTHQPNLSRAFRTGDTVSLTARSWCFDPTAVAMSLSSGGFRSRSGRVSDEAAKLSRKPSLKLSRPAPKTGLPEPTAANARQGDC